MSRQLTLILTPREAADAKTYTTLAARRMGVAERDIALVRVVKRSIDARRGAPKVNLTLEIYVDGEPDPPPTGSTTPRSRAVRPWLSWVPDLPDCSLLCG